MRLAWCLTAAAIIACGAASSAADPSTSVACGPPSNLGPSGHPQVGPLVLGFYTNGENTTGRAKSVFDPGYPTKVLLYTLGRRRLQSVLTLRGRSCAGGKSLRFWYRGSRPFTQLPVSTSELERTGDLDQRLGTRRYGEWRGYMLFTKAGRWKITVSRRARPLGSVVVEVGG